MTDLRPPAPADDPEVGIRRARALLDEGRPDEALAWLDGVLRRRPGEAEAHYLCGLAHFDARRVPEAARSFARAVRCGLDPGRCAGERWMCAMLLGRFGRAWRESDRVLRQRRAAGEDCRHLPLHLRHVWDGTPLDGRAVLLRCYHGLGDTLQFIRYAPLLQTRAARLAVQAEPRLFPLLRSVPGIDALAPLGAADPLYEVDIESMELPHAFRTTLATLPATVPYLAVDPALVAAAGRRLGHADRLRVGVAWASGDWWPERSVPLPALALLGRVPGVALYSLQRGPAATAQGGPAFVGDELWCRDLAETAAMMLNLDLVVSVDTMIAHLAGALGRPVWTLLHHAADWRWMAGRDDSPWYPTMRLFRQPAPGDWRTPIARLAAALEREAATVRGPRRRSRCR